jgi:teichuronic acid biosynthesis glycosyltransferase TuaC
LTQRELKRRKHKVGNLQLSHQSSRKPLRVLAITNLFPNSIQPHAGAFNRQQLGALSQLCDLRILATIPWFPGSKWLMPNSAATRLASLPPSEVIDGLSIEHPRTLYLPSIGRGFSAFTHSRSLNRTVAEAADSTDIIFGAWVYPDGVAAIMLARKFGLPVVVKCFGSDINTLTTYRGPARNIRRYLPLGNVVAVSQPLKQKVIELGVAADKVDVVIDGIDRSLFYPRDQSEARRRLGMEFDGTMIVYVGRTEVTKGLRELFDAYAILVKEVPKLRLVLVGSGSADQQLQQRARSIGGDIHFMGSRPLEEIPLWMSAADIVTLPSYAEGLPNTVLEALACGRPVVATSVGGIPDILTDEFGKLCPPRDVPALTDAFRNVLGRVFDPTTVSNSLPQRDWNSSAAELLAVLERAAAR